MTQTSAPHHLSPFTVSLYRQHSRVSPNSLSSFPDAVYPSSLHSTFQFSKQILLSPLNPRSSSIMLHTLSSVSLNEKRTFLLMNSWERGSCKSGITEEFLKGICRFAFPSCQSTWEKKTHDRQWLWVLGLKTRPHSYKTWRIGQEWKRWKFLATQKKVKWMTRQHKWKFKADDDSLRWKNKRHKVGCEMCLICVRNSDVHRDFYHSGVFGS